MGEIQSAVFYSGTVKGQRTRGRPRRKWEDNIEMIGLELGVGRVDCFVFGWGLVNTVISFLVL